MQTYIYKTADGYEVRCDEPKFTLKVDNLAMAEAFRGTIDFVIFTKTHSKPPEPFAYLLICEKGRIVSSTKDKVMADAWQSLSIPGDRIVPVYENLP
jgi:hypothetical protein